MTEPTHQTMGWGPQSPDAAAASRRQRARWQALEALKDAHRWATRNAAGNTKHPPRDIDLVRKGDLQITAVLMLYSSRLALGDVFWDALLAVLAQDHLALDQRAVLVAPLCAALAQIAGDAA